MYIKKVVVAVLMMCMLVQPLSVSAANREVFEEALTLISQVLSSIQSVLGFAVADEKLATVAAYSTSSTVFTGYSLFKSTYLDGVTPRTKPSGMTRDVAFDAQGNMYVTGGTMSSDFPTTVGAYDRTYATGGASTGRLGTMDVFVMKFSPSGDLLWSTLLGGPNYDRTYALEVGPNGEVVVAGRAGEGFPTTSGALQTTFLNNSVDAARWNAEYGRQNGFVTKFDTNGVLQWSSYFSAGIIRDIDIDVEGNIHLVPTESPASLLFPFLTTNAFQSVLRGTNDGMYAKISPDGQNLLYGTYIGGSGKDGMHPSVRALDTGDVYYSTWSQSTDFPLKNAFQTIRNGKSDAIIAKFAKDGSLIFSSYYGGNGIEQMETHSLAVDNQNNAYLGGSTVSTNLNILGGADNTMSGSGDMFVIKVSPVGQLLASTYLGGNGLDRMEGIEFSNLSNELIITGNTQSTDMATPDGFDTTLAGLQDGILIRTLPDLSKITYSTYFGGDKSDEIRSIDINQTNDDVIFGGMSASSNLSIVQPLDGILNSTVSPFFAVLKNTYVVPPVLSDSDSDSILDSTDNCPLNYNSDQLNFDGDSLGDICDPDDDNDSIADVNEISGCSFDPSTLCPTTPTTQTISGSQPILQFTIASSSVFVGDKGYLSWRAVNASSCTASGSWKGGRTTSGTFTTVNRSSVGTDTFSLTCANSNGLVTKSVSLTAVARIQ
jgi:hypothetical protein